MTNATTIWFFEALKTDSQCFLYNGNFTESVTSKVIKLNESGLINQDESIKIQRRANYLVGECFQNIIKHSDKSHLNNSKNNNSEFFMARSSGGRHFITTGNLIKNKEIPKLEEQITSVNQMDADELKVLYKHVIKTGSISDRGGAGLGIIDMARKSDQEIQYLFKENNAETSIFYNQIEINSEAAKAAKLLTGNFDIQQAIHFHNKMVAEDMLILQKGNFSKESIIPILKIFETNLNTKKSKSSIHKRLYYILVELLQNISHHAYGSENCKLGIFSVSKTNNTFVINAGNYIEKSKIEPFEKHLNFLNLKNNDELHAEYLTRLRGDNKNEEVPGMGLIKLARMIKDGLTFNFTEDSSDLYLFSVSISLDSKFAIQFSPKFRH